MISEQDKKIFFPRSFNEQMAWIDEEVELILQCEKKAKKRNSNAEIVKINRSEGSGHVIARLFKIIKEDPKNVAVLREVETAERELWTFLEHGSGAKSEEEIYAYWHNYLLAYIAELEISPVHYFLICGYDEFHDRDEWIGIYDSLTQLKSAYEDAVQALEHKHRHYKENGWTVGYEKVMINVFDEAVGNWHYDIPYEALFPEKKDCPCKEYKTVKVVLDHADMFMMKREMIKRDMYRDYVCNGTPVRRTIDEIISVRFPVKHTYEIFEMMGQWWGGWDAVPDYRKMGDKAQEWQKKYGAELTEISHDTLIFRCRSLSEDEADTLWRDICQIAPNSQDIKGNGKKKILEQGEFVLWWD